MTEQATRTPLVVGAQADAMLMGATGTTEDAPGWVEHDEAGVPVAFRLFAFGAFTVTQKGKSYQGEFTPQHAAQILDHFRNKGTRVPVDTQHVLHAIANALKVEEQEIAALIGDRVATMAFGDLESREDGLWLARIEWVPIGYKLMQEKLLRYFSPVVRGLQEGPLRVTSVAMTNTPAIDGLQELVADAETGNHHSIFGGPEGSGTESAEQGLQCLLGHVAVLSEAGLGSESGKEGLQEAIGVLEAAHGELSDRRAASLSSAALVADLGDVCGLGAESSPDAILGATRLLAERARDAEAKLNTIALEAEVAERTALLEEGLTDGRLGPVDVDTWAAEAETETLREYLGNAKSPIRAALIAEGEKTGKLSPFMVQSWASKVDVAVLSDYLECAVPIVQMGATVDVATLPDTPPPRDRDAGFARMMGVDPVELNRRLHS
jgi:phage I-like protein